MDYQITNVFVRSNTVIVVVDVPEKNTDFTINFAKTAFEALSTEELQYRIGRIVKEKYEISQTDDALRDKAAALVGGRIGSA